MSTSQNDTKQRAFFIVAIIILVGIIGFLIINSSQQSKQIEKQEEQLSDAERLQLDLERQYYESLAELEQQRGNNEQLNALIEAQKQELKQQKDQISQLIKTKSDLSAARAQIDRLKSQTTEYLAQIEDLRVKNRMLEESNQSLSAANTELSQTVERTRMEKDEILSEKSTIQSEKERLAMTNKDLSRKVSKASMIEVNNIKIQGLEIKNSGKERKKSKAGAVDRLRICFDLTENKIADSGFERFYIRIIGPQGETLAVETSGSGTFISSESGENVLYSKIKEVEYDNTKSNQCINYDQDIDFIKGEYIIEIYNKGYLAGKSNFRLK
jgi:hypothetical protein